MRNLTRHFQRLWRLRVTFVAGLIMLGRLRPFLGVVLAQTADSDDSSRFTYNTSASLNVKQVSVTDRDGATIQDIAYTGRPGYDPAICMKRH